MDVGRDGRIEGIKIVRVWMLRIIIDEDVVSIENR